MGSTIRAVARTGKRKLDHLRIALDSGVAFKGVTSGFENYQFVHQALPEIDKASIDLSVSLFGKLLSAPLVISAMVGGIPEATPINMNLARAAQALGIAMGVGSQRHGLDDPSNIVSYQVRAVAPDILLFANLGAVQLNNGYSSQECQKAVDMIQADALVLHLNPLQEALQEEGDTNFSGLLSKIERVCREVRVPVIVKEVGWGISEDVARKLSDAGVAAIDVAGAGGTSWSEVERRRSGQGPGGRLIDGLAATFAQWGIPTADSVTAVRKSVPDITLIASGGIRNGLDVAKAIALGADVAGVAAPLINAARDSTEAVQWALERIREELRLAMFCIGSASIAELKNSPLLVRNRT